VSDQVTLCTRSGFLSVPSQLAEGLPLDTFISNLFECSHVHPVAEHFKVKWRFATPFIRLGFLLGTGSSLGYNQWAGTKPSRLVQRGYLIINKSTAALPWINKRAKAGSWLGRTLYGALDETPMFKRLAGREIVTRQGRITKVQGRSVWFSDGASGEFDVIVMATGYKVSFPFLKHLHRGALPASAEAWQPSQDVLPEQHNICSRDEPTLGFIGFVRPNVGAIPPIAELQVQWLILRMEGCIAGPRRPPSYKLLAPNDRTGAYAVDHGAYMSDLARDMGANPSIRELLWRSPKALLAWALGQAYPTFYRLRGPFAWPGAFDIAENELLEPVKRRPLAANLLFCGIISLFAAVNAAALASEPLFRLTNLLSITRVAF
jgi:dimethylaniline monooxygenase (N-oxide forming)